MLQASCVFACGPYAGSIGARVLGSLLLGQGVDNLVPVEASVYEPPVNSLGALEGGRINGCPDLQNTQARIRIAFCRIGAWTQALKSYRDILDPEHRVML